MKSVRWIVSYILVASLGLWLAFAVSMKFMAPAHSQEAPSSGEIPAEFMKEVEATQVPAATATPTPTPTEGAVPSPSEQIPPPPAGETPLGDAVTAPQSQAPLENLVRDGYVYDPTGKRDPFKVFKTVRPLQVDAIKQTEILEPLQRWELERLRVVGILWDVRTPRAMIKDPDGVVFVVTKNSKVGRNEGFVAAIREGEVVIVETKYEDGKALRDPKVLELKK